MTSLTFQTRREPLSISVGKEQGIWLAGMLEKLSDPAAAPLTLKDVEASYAAAGLEDFELFWDNKPVNTLYKAGLLQL